MCIRYPLQTNCMRQKTGACSRTYMAFLDLRSVIFLQCQFRQILNKTNSLTEIHYLVTNYSIPSFINTKTESVPKYLEWDLSAAAPITSLLIPCWEMSSTIPFSILSISICSFSARTYKYQSSAKYIRKPNMQVVNQQMIQEGIFNPILYQLR